MITREADYALRTIAYLAKDEVKNEKVSTKLLAKEMAIPYRFLRKIVKSLIDNDLILGLKGKGGGIKLAKDKKYISFAEVINTISPKCTKITTCLDEDYECERVKKVKNCPISNKLKSVQLVLNEELSKQTFEDFK